MSVTHFLPANPITGSVLLQASITNEIQIKLDFQLPSRYDGNADLSFMFVIKRKGL